jgi:hypothetical protein
LSGGAVRDADAGQHGGSAVDDIAVVDLTTHVGEIVPHDQVVAGAV